MSDEFDPYAVHGKPDHPKRDRIGETVEAGTTAAQELRGIVERMEQFAEDKSEIGDVEKAEMARAKARGFDTKAIRTIIRMRKQDPSKLANEQTVLDTYLAAMGMLGGGE